jgi:ParB/RepB/Spo0J family partition protein
MRKNSSELSVVSSQPPAVNAAAATRFADIYVADLRMAPWNARKTFDETAMADFTANIKLHGFQVPLIVRPLGPKGFEIVAGHRRYKAALALDFDWLPCIVRELTDEQAREIGLVDNLQREDVPALEEAEAFGELLGALGSIAAIAARVGKEAAYVAKRLKLRELTAWSQDALRERLITIDHAMLLARLAEAEQNAALKWCLDRNAGVKVPVEEVLKDRLTRIARKNAPDGDEEDGEGEDTDAAAERRPRWRRDWEPETVQRLKEHIECESGIPLDRAPWPMEEDWLVPDAGSCLDCPKNTKANAPLFSDLDMGVAICTDGACFKAKTVGFVELQVRDTAKARANDLGRSSPGDVEILRVSWKTTSTVPRQLKDGGGVNPAQTFKDGQWIEAKKNCEHALPAVTVDWSDPNGREGTVRKPGEVVQACIAPKCEAHPKAYERAKASAGREKPVDPAEQARERQKWDFLAKEETKIRAKVFGAVLGALDQVSAVRMVADNQRGSADVRKWLLARFPKIGGALLEALTVFTNNFSSKASASPYWLMGNGIAGDRKELWKLAASVGVKADEVAAKHFHDAGSIAPLADVLYPKGVKWPKDTEPAKKAAVKSTPKKQAAAKKKMVAAVKKKLKKQGTGIREQGTGKAAKKAGKR